MAKSDPPAKKPTPPMDASTKVTVAFPFSTIRMDDDTEKLAELVAIVADLAEQVGHMAPSKQVTTIQQRLVDLQASLE